MPLHTDGRGPMNDIAHRTVSGVPDGSRAARRTEPHREGRTPRLAGRIQRLPSLVVSWLTANAVAVLISAVMVGVGLLTTKVVLQVAAVERADNWLPTWLAEHRTSSLTEASHIGSLLGDAPVLVPLVAAVAVALALRRRWRLATFVIQAGLAEGLMYLITTTFVSRERPDVVQLDQLNPQHSFPSGHTAAAVAVYGSLGLLLTAHFRQAALRVVVWSAAVLIPFAVGLSRIYRGEHHPIDVAAGAAMGVGAVVAALVAARMARMVAELHVARRSMNASAEGAA
jgi:membrane-associated phospholipid phosphatase